MPTFQIKTKAIAYAFPTSQHAEDLGFAKTGCYFVQQTAEREDGSLVTFMPHDAEGFENGTDADLVALFHEYEGEPDWSFRAYGKPEILAAVGLEPIYRI